jgi:oleate hydratase
MSVVLAFQPHFPNQPSGVNVCWGYGLFPDKPGNFVKKRMSECTGEEILRELCAHLRFDEDLPVILKTSTCIPCMMPFITSQFLPRAMGDRPPVIPRGSTNLAFLGQYCEIPGDVVFTVEYSVRSAQIGVYSLLKLNRKVPPIYKGQFNPRVLGKSLEPLFK